MKITIRHKETQITIEESDGRSHSALIQSHSDNIIKIINEAIDGIIKLTKDDEKNNKKKT